MLGFDIIVCFLFAAGIMKMWTTYRVDHAYGKAGKDSPRYKVKLAKFKAGGSDTAPKRLGGKGYFRELWNDMWDDLHEHRQKVRAEKKAGERKKLRHRFKGWWDWAWKPLGEDEPASDEPDLSQQPGPEPETASTGKRPDAETQEPAPQLGAQPDAPFTCAECGAAMAGPGACPNCGTTYGPKPTPQPTPQPQPGLQPAASGGHIPRHAHPPTPTPQIPPPYDEEAAQLHRCPSCNWVLNTLPDGRGGWVLSDCVNPDCPRNKQPANSNGGTDMDGTDANTYELAKAAVARVREILARMQDNATVIRDRTAEANNASDALDQDREALKPALDQLIADLQGKEVDTETVQHAQDVLDRVAPDDIKVLNDHLDAVNHGSGDLVNAIDGAVQSADATDESLTSKYGDLVDGIAKTGVNPDFLK